MQSYGGIHPTRARYSREGGARAHRAASRRRWAKAHPTIAHRNGNRRGFYCNPLGGGGGGGIRGLPAVVRFGRGWPRPAWKGPENGGSDGAAEGGGRGRGRRPPCEVGGAGMEAEAAVGTGAFSGSIGAPR